MTPRFQLKKSLKKAMQDLKRHGVVDSPVFHIKSRNPKLRCVIYRPCYGGTRDFMPGEIATNLHKLCNDHDAEEVVTVANTFLHSMDNESSPPQEALIAVLEQEDKVFSVVQQYKIDGAGKIRFGKKHWTTQTKTGPMGSFDSLVQQ
jgi:hypothetical protein